MNIYRSLLILGLVSLIGPALGESVVLTQQNGEKIDVDLVRLSQVKTLTKNMNKEDKCLHYGSELREMLKDFKSLQNDIFNKLVDALRQRKLPMNNKQPVLADLEDCLGLPHSEDQTLPDLQNPVEVIAGPQETSEQAVANEPMKDVLNEFENVKKNVKDYGQDLYYKGNKLVSEGAEKFGDMKKVFNVPVTGPTKKPDQSSQVEVIDTTDKSPAEYKTEDLVKSEVDDNEHDDDDDADEESEGDRGDVEQETAESESVHQAVGSQNDLEQPLSDQKVLDEPEAPESPRSGATWRRTSNSRTFSYSNSYDSRKDKKATAYAHAESHFSHDSSDSGDQPSKASESPAVAEDNVELSCTDKLAEANRLIEHLSKDLDEREAQLSSLNNKVDSMAKSIKQAEAERASSGYLLEKSRFNTMKELYERSVKREEDLTSKVKELESRLSEAARSGSRLQLDKDSDDDDEKLDDAAKIAAKLYHQIDSGENVFNRCYKYLLAFTLPGKITKRALKTIASLSIRKPAMEDFYSQASMMSTKADALIRSGKKHAQAAGKDIRQCLSRPYSSRSSNSWVDDSVLGSAMRPIPPMPDMPPFPRRIPGIIPMY